MTHLALRDQREQPSNATSTSASLPSRASSRALEPNSDADVLVAFDGRADSRRYVGLQFYLEALLGCPVDLVTEQALRPHFRPFIEPDAIRV